MVITDSTALSCSRDPIFKDFRRDNGPQRETLLKLISLPMGLLLLYYMLISRNVPILPLEPFYKRFFKDSYYLIYFEVICFWFIWLNIKIKIWFNFVYCAK